MKIKQEYMNARRNYLRMVNRYIKQGYEIDQRFKPIIPKKPTQASIRNLKNLEKRLKEKVHEERVETGYYTRQREQRAIQSKIKKAAQTKPKVSTKVYKKPPHPIETKVPKVKGKSTQPPNVSDAVLRTFESEMTIAKNYVAKSKPFQDAVNEAGRDAQYEFEKVINDILNKYIPDLTKHDVRVEVAQKLSENFENYIKDMETYLYEFISDGQGGLDHTSAGIGALGELIRAISGAELTIEEKQKLQELANEVTEGDVTEGIGEYYDY